MVKLAAQTLVARGRPRRVMTQPRRHEIAVDTSTPCCELRQDVLRHGTASQIGDRDHRDRGLRTDQRPRISCA
jgi:hypothetical protein